MSVTGGQGDLIIGKLMQLSLRLSVSGFRKNIIPPGGTAVLCGSGLVQLFGAMNFLGLSEAHLVSSKCRSGFCAIWCIG